MAQPKIKLESRFPAAREAAYEVTALARDLALDVGEEVVHRKVEQVNDQRGYDLPEDRIGKEKTGFQSGKVYLGAPDEFWWRFFEYGTRYIVAFPMIRPAHRAMRKTFIATMDKEFEGWIRRRPMRRKLA